MRGMTIRIERVRRGLTQAKLAKMSGLSQVLVSKLERGVYTLSKETSVKIRRIFKEIDENGRGDTWAKG